MANSIQQRHGFNHHLQPIPNDEPITLQDMHFEIEIAYDHIEIWQLPPYSKKIAEYPDLEALARALKPETVLSEVSK